MAGNPKAPSRLGWILMSSVIVHTRVSLEPYQGDNVQVEHIK